MTTWEFELERVDTPIGRMLVVTDDQQRLRAIDWQDCEPNMRLLMRRQYRSAPIVLPCHRVIGSNASLTGYGGGLHRKQWLLEHERRWRER